MWRWTCLNPQRGAYYHVTAATRSVLTCHVSLCVWLQDVHHDPEDSVGDDDQMPAIAVSPPPPVLGFHVRIKTRRCSRLCLEVFVSLAWHFLFYFCKHSEHCLYWQQRNALNSESCLCLCVCPLQSGSREFDWLLLTSKQPLRSFVHSHMCNLVFSCFHTKLTVAL